MDILVVGLTAYYHAQKSTMSDIKQEVSPEASISRFAETVAYKQLRQLKSEYKFSRLTQETNGTTVAVSLTGEVTSQFNISAVPFNPARSRVRFTLTIPADAAGCTVVPRDRFPFFSSLYTETEQGVQIVRQNYMNYNTITQRMLKTSFGKQQSIPSDEILFKSNLTADTNYRFDGTAADSNDTEPLYISQSSDLKAAISPITYDVALGDIFPGSFWGLDKTVFIGRGIRLVKTWAIAQAYGWISDSKTQNGAANKTALVQTPTITNLNLYLAVEQNPEVVRNLMDQYNSQGLRYMFENTQTVNNVVQNSTEHNVTIRGINRAQGLRLLKVIHNCFSRTEVAGAPPQATNRRFDNSMAGVTGTYFTSLNDENMQSYAINLASNEDFMLQKPILRGSCITSRGQYKNSWFHMDNFETNEGPEDEPKNADRLKRGLDLTTISGDYKWGFLLQNTPSSSIAHYTHLVYQRELYCGKDAVKIDSTMG